MRELFRRFAAGTAAAVGSPWAFTAAVLLLLGAIVLGPALGYSEAWRVFITSYASILSLLLLLLLQNSLNREMQAMQIKLDEVLRVIEGARKDLVDIEESTDEELEAEQEESRRTAEVYRPQPEEEEGGEDDG